MSATTPPPATIDWTTIELPDAWPDQVSWRSPATCWRLLRAFISKQRVAVQTPADMPGRSLLPRYVLQEFHNLPNGNYSKSICAGYANSFDRVMLGCMHAARQQLAEQLRAAKRVLDIGTGGGQLATVLSAPANAGPGREVWALEPSPYLLQHAARKLPGLQAVQGVIEQTEFPDGFFDGAGACFVFHEIPPRYADQALRELHRILRPGAVLALVEPAAEQLRSSWLQMWRRYGLRGLYFRWLALRMFEPFVLAWQARDHKQWLAQHGFELLSNECSMPYQLIVARRRADTGTTNTEIG